MFYDLNFNKSKFLKIGGTGALGTELINGEEQKPSKPQTHSRQLMHGMGKTMSLSLSLRHGPTNSKAHRCSAFSLIRINKLPYVWNQLKLNFLLLPAKAVLSTPSFQAEWHHQYVKLAMRSLQMPCVCIWHL